MLGAALLSLGILLAASGGVVHAQTNDSNVNNLMNTLRGHPSSGGSSQVTLFDPLQGQGFSAILASVVNFLVVDIAIPLTSIMVLVGAFQMITYSGDPEKYGKGRKTLLWAAIGFVVSLVATSVVTLIRGIFGVG